VTNEDKELGNTSNKGKRESLPSLLLIIVRGMPFIQAGRGLANKGMAHSLDGCVKIATG